jgi:hypothetical protein
MKSIKIALIIALIVPSAFATAQENLLFLFKQDASSCDIDFTPSTSIAAIELFAKCFVYQSPELEAQQALQIKDIDFKNLPKLTDTETQFVSLQSKIKEPLIQFGNYEYGYLNNSVNNPAFFEATRNSVLSAAYVIAPGIPEF